MLGAIAVLVPKGDDPNYVPLFLFLVVFMALAILVLFATVREPKLHQQMLGDSKTLSNEPEEEEEDGGEDFGMSSSRGGDLADDPIYIEAMQFVMENGKVSISLLQRRFRIGFNRAARFVEQMEKDGILGQADGTRPRTVNR